MDIAAVVVSLCPSATSRSIDGRLQYAGGRLAARALRDWAEELLSESAIKAAGLLDAKIVRQTWSEHRSGARNWQHSLWSVLVLHSWLMNRRVMDPRGPDRYNATYSHARCLRLAGMLCVALLFVSGCENGESLRIVDPELMRMVGPELTRSTASNEGILAKPTGTVTSKPCEEGEGHLFYPLGKSADLTCRELQVEAHQLLYRGFLFSRGSFDTLVIYQEGHLACIGAPRLSHTIRLDALELVAELTDHSDVLYLDMAGVGTNCDQQVSTPEGMRYLSDHNVLAALDRPRQSALAYFVDHVGAMVDALAPNYATVDMVGRSGGGWATTLYAALDWRISRSISVAGTVPLRLRQPIAEDPRDDSGDWEQTGAYLYRMLGYYNLYEAAGYGHSLLAPESKRHHVQIYNEFDVCCFSGVKGLLAAEGFVERYPNNTSVQFLVLGGMYDHAVPVELVQQKLFDDMLIDNQSSCRGVLLEEDSESTCMVQ